MEDKNSIFALEEQEVLDLLESIKKVHDQEKKLLTDNAFVYLCLRQSFNEPPSAKRITGRVKAFPSPDKPY